jgi:hypothetical protein
LTIARRSDSSNEPATSQRRASDASNASNIIFDTLGTLLLL